MSKRTTVDDGSLLFFALSGKRQTKTTSCHLTIKDPSTAAEITTSAAWSNYKSIFARSLERVRFIIAGYLKEGPEGSHRRMRLVTSRWYIPDRKLPRATIDFPQGKIMHKTMGMFF